jgi:hypothetical protein
MRTCEWCGRNYSHYRMTHPGARDYCSDKCEQEAKSNASSQSIFQGNSQASPEEQAQAAAFGCIGALALGALACMVGLFFLPYLIYGWLFHGMTFSVESVINCFGNIWAWVISVVFWLGVGLIINAIHKQQSNNL